MRPTVGFVALLLPVAAAAAPHFVLPAAPVLSGEPVGLALAGLPPKAKVVVVARRAGASGAQLESTATFAADGRGSVDLAHATPLAGSYTTAGDAGLFWSMTETAPKSELPKGLVRVVATVDGVEAATADLHLEQGRADLVTTPVPAQQGAFVISAPADGKRHGAIIVLGGSEGGDWAARSLGARLASRGFVVLGFPYYAPAYGGPSQFPDLPAAFADIPVDRLQAAHDILAARADVDPARIGVYGVSKGAEYALLAASHFAWLHAVVAIVPSDVVWEGWGKPVAAGTLSSFSWQGKPLAFVPYDDIMVEFMKAAKGEAMALRGPHERGKLKHPESLAAARIRVADYRGALLVAGGGKDQVWPSFDMAANVAATRRAHGETTLLLNYPDAGHGLSGDGYGSTGYTAGIGGTPASNAAAQLDLWPKTIAFLKRWLGK